MEYNYSFFFNIRTLGFVMVGRLGQAIFPVRLNTLILKPWTKFPLWQLLEQQLSCSGDASSSFAQVSLTLLSISLVAINVDVVPRSAASIFVGLRMQPYHVSCGDQINLETILNHFLFPHAIDVLKDYSWVSLFNYLCFII